MAISRFYQHIQTDWKKQQEHGLALFKWDHLITSLEQSHNPACNFLRTKASCPQRFVQVHGKVSI